MQTDSNMKTSPDHQKKYKKRVPSITRMMAATAKATSGATVLTTSCAMMLKPPHTVSSRRGGDTFTSSQLVPSMLSELSFDHEVHRIDINAIMSQQNERTGRGIENSSKGNLEGNDNESLNESLFTSWTWKGLLCFSSIDDDLFFDAEENLPLSAEEGMDPDGKIIDMKTSASTAELTEFSTESFESIEIKLDKGKPTVEIACDLRGGHYQMPDGHQSPLEAHDRRGNAAAFDHPSRPPRGRQRLNQSASNASHNPFARIHAPPAPKELPIRFLRAGKGDPVEGQRRYEATLEWRKENDIDNILFEAYPMFEMIKQHYPHYFHLRGKQGEPVFFEQPPKTDLAALKAGGCDLDGLVRHYTMVTEFQWQFIERDDFARSITVFDLEGMRMMDFVGEVVDYVKMCSQFTGQHYPERAGHVIVINVPRW